MWLVIIFCTSHTHPAQVQQHGDRRRAHASMDARDSPVAIRGQRRWTSCWKIWYETSECRRRSTTPVYLAWRTLYLAIILFSYGRAKLTYGGGFRRLPLISGAWPVHVYLVANSLENEMCLPGNTSASDCKLGIIISRRFLIVLLSCKWEQSEETRYWNALCLPWCGPSLLVKNQNETCVSTVT